MSNVAESFYFSIRYWSLRNFFSIPTHLTYQERITLYRLGSQLSKSSSAPIALEIGSYLGASAAFIASGLSRSCQKGKVICVDTWENHSMSEGKRDTMAEFIENTKNFSNWVHPIRGWSTAVVDQVIKHSKQINLLFIDGDHSYEGCLQDWRTYRPFLASNATVVIHDIGWASGVAKVIDEEVRPLVSREYRLPNMWWGALQQ